MYKIVKKRELNPTVTMMDIDAPFVARKAEPGQFIILRVDADGERIPLTVAGYDRKAGTVKIIFQIVGATTELLNHKKEGEYIRGLRRSAWRRHAYRGPQESRRLSAAASAAPSRSPSPQKLHELGCEVHSHHRFPQQGSSSFWRTSSRPASDRAHRHDRRRFSRPQGRRDRAAERADRSGRAIMTKSSRSDR